MIHDYKAQWLGCMRFLIVVGLSCSFSYRPAILLKLGHAAFSKRSTSKTSTSYNRNHVFLGLAGSCPPLSERDCHCLCRELPLPPAAAKCFAGICSQMCKSTPAAHHAVLKQHHQVLQTLYYFVYKEANSGEG